MAQSILGTVAQISVGDNNGAFLRLGSMAQVEISCHYLKNSSR